jgi:hypothetical protein
MVGSPQGCQWRFQLRPVSSEHLAQMSISTSPRLVSQGRLPCEYCVMQLGYSTFRGHCFTTLRRIRRSNRYHSARSKWRGRDGACRRLARGRAQQVLRFYNAVHLLFLNDKGAARTQLHLHQNGLEHNTRLLPLATLEKLPVRKLFRFL